MADRPSDVRWPPSNDISFDSIFDRLIDLKVQHFPEHTVRDIADPYVQIMALTAALGQHAFGRANHALKQLAPKTATSRRALVSLLEIVNRPLAPIQPARGKVYARLKAASVADTVMIEEGQRIAPTNTVDPVFTIDSDVSIGSVAGISTWSVLAGSVTLESVYPATLSAMEVDDYIIFGSDGSFFDELTIDVGTTALPAITASWEYYNDETGEVTSASIVGSNLEFDISDYLNGSVPEGLEVTITHTPTNVSETVDTASGVATTSFLGQSSPSESATDYSVFAEWRPVPGVTDGTVGMTQDGVVSWDVTGVKDSDNDWVPHDTYGFAVRMRIADDPSVLLPSDLDLDSAPDNPDGDWFVEGYITQGVRRTISLGQTDGSAFQALPISSVLIDEPVADPMWEISIGTETDWAVVADFSNSGPASKHAVLKEDPDDGWTVVLGNGTVGVLPTSGLGVSVTIRTDSQSPGDLDPNAGIRALSGLGLVTGFVLFRGTTGFAEAEASDANAVMEFRNSILPQLALRAESAITAPEIVTALTGGAPNRATFTTADGRTPFSRALFSLEGAGDRQYRVMVVGAESDPYGTVDSNDLDEAETWLNGTPVGVEIVGGHGPNNTEAIVGSFVSRPMRPTIVLTVKSAQGVLAQADQIVRQFFKPHSKDEDLVYRWSFGGKVPVPILFGLLWEGVPNRTFLTLTVSDGVLAYTAGDSIQLESFELPTLDPAYSAAADISIVVG